MACAVEATPHEETRIYSSILEGGNLMQKFEEGELQDTAADGDERNDRGYPIRSEGKYVASSNPWPRDEQKEARDIAGVQKRKPYTHRRQGNRWDQYGESSSAASSEAHIMSDYVHSESTWGPYESAHRESRDKRAAQPYRLQKANKSEGQRSRWASDIRQLQPDHWSSSSKWQSSAGDDGSWKKVSDWEGSQWSAPTGRTLKGSEYETDQEWQLRNMRYGDGWAYDSTQSHCKRAKPTYTDPEDDRMTDSSLPIGSTSKTYDPKKDGNFWQRGDSGQDWSHSSSSSGQWRPRLWHEKNISSGAGDTSDASNAVHHLGSIHEGDGDAVRASSEWKDQCRLSVALSQMTAEEMALRTFVLMRSEMFLRSLSWRQHGPQSFGCQFEVLPVMTAVWTTVLRCLLGVNSDLRQLSGTTVPSRQ